MTTAITSPTLARQAVAADLTSLGSVFQPAIRLPLNKPVAVGLSPAGQNDTEFLVRISVYASTANDSVTAIATVEDYTDKVEDLLTLPPRSDWTTNWDPEVLAWHASTVVSVPREDF